MTDVSSNQPLKVEVDDERDRAIYAAGFIPGWIGEGGLRPEPQQDFLPHRWQWSAGRSLLRQAASYIDPKKSERRNIRMANPTAGKRTSLNTIHCSYQMVAPRDFARAHRHTVSAGRFILESEGAFTTLDGEKVYMAPNDIILTPNWVWHGMGNESEQKAAFWIDFLDDPLVQHLQTIFFEVRDEIESDLPERRDSPLHIKWTDVQNRLEALADDSDDRCGRRLTIPSDAVPSIRLYMQRLESGQVTRPYKSTANRLFVCADGDGATEINGSEFDWQRGDVIAVPSWCLFQHRARTVATLFEITDEPILHALNWYREVTE